MRRIATSLLVIAMIAMIAASCAGETTINAEPAASRAGSDSPPVADRVDGEAEASTVPDLAVELVGLISDEVGDGLGGAIVLYRTDKSEGRFAVGVADAAGRPLEPDDRMRVGSISKPFVATMVLQMVDEGVVDLDATISEYIETPVGGEVTVRQLLRHRSGIANYTENRDLMFSTMLDRAQVVSPSKVLEAVVDQPALPAGGSFRYSNTNYLLLGLLIEAVDGQDLQSSLVERIVGPLGLIETAFVLGSFQADDVGGWATGLTNGEPTAEYTSIASGAWAAGALVSTAAELATFLDALIAGDLVPQPLLSEMLDTSSGGYGMGMAQNFVPSRQAVGHNGSIPGFQSFMSIDPETRELVVVLTNSDRLNPEKLAGIAVTGWS